MAKVHITTVQIDCIDKNKQQGSYLIALCTSVNQQVPLFYLFFTIYYLCTICAIAGGGCIHVSIDSDKAASRFVIFHKVALEGSCSLLASLLEFTYEYTLDIFIILLSSLALLLRFFRRILHPLFKPAGIFAMQDRRFSNGSCHN